MKPDHSTRRGISRRRVLQAAGGSTLVGLAGCTGMLGDSGNGGGGKPESVKIGLIVPRSGAYGALGQRFRDGFSVQADTINESQNLLPETTLKYVTADTKSDPQTGLNEARRLVIQEEVDMLCGTANSEVAGSVSTFAAQEDIPFFIGQAANQALTTGDQCQKTNVRVLTTTEILPKVGPTFGVENIGERGYVLYPDYTTGYQHRDLSPPAIEAAGGTVAGVSAAPLGNQDWATIIDKIESANPDFLFFGVMGSGVTPFLSQAANRGFDIPIIGNLLSGPIIGGLSQEVLDNLPELYRGTRYTREIDNQANKDFVSLFQEEYGSPPVYSNGYGAVNADVIGNTLHKASSASTDNVISAVEGLTWDTIVGETTIRECDHQGTPNSYISRVTGIDSSSGLGTYEIAQTYDSAKYITPCEGVNCSFE